MLGRVSLSIAAVALSAAHAWAGPIAQGQTNTENVLGSTSIYAVEGNNGGSGATPAIETTFAAAADNIFTFSASGLIGCCGPVDVNFTPDGASGATNINPTNGLSGVFGDGRVPLVGVFTDGTNPFGGTAPATLSHDRDGVGTDFSPLLFQVFYIGDGRTGANNAGGTVQTFNAPGTATKLFLGTADGFGFTGNPATFNDNGLSGTGFTVDVTLQAVNEVPVPAGVVLLATGVLGLGALRRRPRS